MDAKHSILSFGDIVKIWLRKFMRLAPVYYTMWPIIWALTSRLVQGPISYNGNINMATCSTDWKQTLFMVGNLSMDMSPYNGCYQQAWPLQMDMQLTLFVPFIAVLLWKLPKVGITFCFMMIIANLFINYFITQKYDLKIGFADVHNYFLL